MRICPRTVYFMDEWHFVETSTLSEDWWWPKQGRLAHVNLFGDYRSSWCRMDAKCLLTLGFVNILAFPWCSNPPPPKKTYEANKTDALWPPFTFVDNGWFYWKGFILVYSLRRKQIFQPMLSFLIENNCAEFKQKVRAEVPVVSHSSLAAAVAVCPSALHSGLMAPGRATVESTDLLRALLRGNSLESWRATQLLCALFL